MVSGRCGGVGLLQGTHLRRGRAAGTGGTPRSGVLARIAGVVAVASDADVACGVHWGGAEGAGGPTCGAHLEGLV